MEAESELLKGFFRSGGLGSGLSQARIGQGGHAGVRLIQAEESVPQARHHF